jgi:hypothetical protein
MLQADFLARLTRGARSGLLTPLFFIWTIRLWAGLAPAFSPIAQPQLGSPSRLVSLVLVEMP